MRETCPGYRDEWELVFRDQTDQTIKRTKEKRARSANAAGANDSPPARGLSPSPDEIGINYFIRNFVIGNQSSSRGYLNYIPSVYLNDGEHPTLVSSLAAVGLVALANSTQQPELASHARAKYSEAICNINSALASPSESVKDSTLMSVISLGLFEQVSGFDTWLRHVEGAAALVVARGKKQFSTPVTIRMFIQARADLVIASLHSTKPIPKDMLELQEEAAKHTDTTTAFWQLGVLGTRCANLLFALRGSIRGGAWAEYLEEATSIERDFQRTVERLAIAEPYTTTQEPSGDPTIVLNGRVDRYKDIWSIRLWNNCRNLQMILCEMICYLLNGLLGGDLPSTLQMSMNYRLQETLERLSKLGNDFLATIPQAMELSSLPSDPRPSLDLSFRGNVTGGYMLTWGLYMVGKCAVTTKETRKWIIQRLQSIGSNSGTAVALQLAEDIIKIDQLSV
ncbi:Protein of unknown function DUF3468 [Penicillium daleae]|uniref:Transcription factor domain-containing protein n=1 Tax=Penicillium daleae TaxID=63821 RepID=A0AAD6FY66_9EURO|nr:Protein of unknown function DUF3468 [Penicillium daleae]KAJ5438598.1 Protein of unknown function DUF3468 [Penicillium daleae]